MLQRFSCISFLFKPPCLHVYNFAVVIIFMVQQSMFNLWEVYHINPSSFCTVTHICHIFPKNEIDIQYALVRTLFYFVLFI